MSRLVEYGPQAVLHAVIDTQATTTNAIVPAVSDKRIRVLSYVIIVGSAGTVQWESGTTDLSGAMSLASNGGVAAPFNPAGHFQTGVNEVLNINQNVSANAKGHLTYVLI
jgi:hypothetical protein